MAPRRQVWDPRTNEMIDVPPELWGMMQAAAPSLLVGMMQAAAPSLLDQVIEATEARQRAEAAAEKAQAPQPIGPNVDLSKEAFKFDWGVADAASVTFITETRREDVAMQEALHRKQQQRDVERRREAADRAVIAAQQEWARENPATYPIRNTGKSRAMQAMMQQSLAMREATEAMMRLPSVPAFIEYSKSDGSTFRVQQPDPRGAPNVVEERPGEQFTWLADPAMQFERGRRICVCGIWTCEFGPFVTVECHAHFEPA